MRHRTREKILCSLYCTDLLDKINSINTNKLDVAKEIGHHLLNNSDDINYYNNTLHGILNNISSIESILARYLGNKWSLKQIGYIEKNILIISIYEYIYLKLDIKIIISTSLKLCDKYLEEHYCSFIHGVLSAYLNDINK